MLCVAAAVPARAQSAAGEVRTKLEKWVETRHLVSAERSEWEADRELLRETRTLLQRQKETLEKEIDRLKESSTEADEERRRLLLERADLQRARGALEEEIVGLEQKALALAPRLPEPLRRKLEPLLVQIPEDPERGDTALGPRLVNVLGVLAQVEKFDGTATFVGETRAVEGGTKVQVRTLYWGLGQAVYVDARGRRAGIGRPGANGWEFVDEPALAGAAQRLLDIYEGNVDVIDFVEIPVEIR